ncbi:TetR/AcrR family transcriptional regulator [Actinophytocola sediminis]
MAEQLNLSDRPLRADARDNRARLMATARQVFAEHGVDASLRDVARRAEVGIGTLYRHFPDREALLEALLGDGLDSLRASAENLLAAASPGDALVVWLGEFAAGSATYRGLPSSVLSAVHDEGSPLYAACSGMTIAASALVLRAQRAGVVDQGVTITDLCTLAAGIASASEHVPNQPDLTPRLLALCARGFLSR